MTTPRTSGELPDPTDGRRKGGSWTRPNRCRIDKKEPTLGVKSAGPWGEMSDTSRMYRQVTG